jgi:chemotaxis protein CheD
LDNVKYLKQGELVVAGGDMKIFTILGSCVAVFLWDEGTRIGGANHFLLPHWNKQGVPDVKYGDVAITELHDKVILHGAVKRRLVAKIYGGASMFKMDKAVFNVGQRNVEIAKQKLMELNVPIVEENTGGTSGRRIFFDPATGNVKHEVIKSVQL